MIGQPLPILASLAGFALAFTILVTACSSCHEAFIVPLIVDVGSGGEEEQTHCNDVEIVATCRGRELEPNCNSATLPFCRCSFPEVPTCPVSIRVEVDGESFEETVMVSGDKCISESERVCFHGPC